MPTLDVRHPSNEKEKSDMKIAAFAVNLAEYKIRVHRFDARSEKRLAKTLKRAEFLAFFSSSAML